MADDLKLRKTIKKGASWMVATRFGGRDMRLTDVFGHVLHDIVA